MSDKHLSDSYKHLGTLLLRVQQFSAGSLNLRDEERSGRPTTAVTEENISAVEALIKEDLHRTYKDIEGP